MRCESRNLTPVVKAMNNEEKEKSASADDL